MQRQVPVELAQDGDQVAQVVEHQGRQDQADAAVAEPVQGLIEVAAAQPTSGPRRSRAQAIVPALLRPGSEPRESGKR
ncbi:hypothetical protein [Actinomadura rubrisoli]|uniref:hypothetical protein n=1 Tax=Actinomadura rubrisoli TaxID=2530368 RepID=UPI001044657E|nr:hypothetical protein [Actinomadura rubrisoli]